MNSKSATQRVYQWINDGTFNPANGCRHPRSLIADALGLSEKTISRCVAQLEATGRLRVQRPGRRGECNTYFVVEWSPPHRIKTLARLRQFKCPPKRTAGLSRAHTSPNSSSQLNDQRCGREPVNQGEQEARMPTPIQLIHDRLEAAGCRPRGPEHRFMACCPGHEDSDASLSVKEADDGRVLVNCFAGCTAVRVTNELGMQLRDLFAPPIAGSRCRRPKQRRREGQPTRRETDQLLAREGLPVDRVLARALDYRSTPTLNFWIATCRACTGELWIHAGLDEEGRPTGPVTLSCENGCFKNAGRS